ncbi:MAG: ribonuclease Z [Candidatus Delongbacteria bacterium]
MKKTGWIKPMAHGDRIIILGSSGAAPTKKRNCTSMVFATESYGIMFDCAEGTQRQLIRAGYKISRIKYILISHLHFDHVGGLIPMLCTKSMFGIKNKITIIGPSGISEFINFNLSSAGSRLAFEYDVIEVREESDTRFFEEFVIETIALNHRIESYGFRIKFYDKPGNIIPDKLREFGIEEGPLCGKLKKNGHIVLQNGKTVNLSDVATEKKRGKIISFAGDTYLCKGLYRCIKDADLAAIESTFLDSEIERAKTRTHLTAKMAGNVAERSNVKELLLYHFSASYPNIEDFKNECFEKFKKKIHLAEDLKVIYLNE